MFKNNNFENEIYQSMESKLASNQVENKYGFDKLSRCIDYLKTAADLFEKAGMHDEAEEVDDVLSKLTHQDKYKKNDRVKFLKDIQRNLYALTKDEKWLNVNINDFSDKVDDYASPLENAKSILGQSKDVPSDYEACGYCGFDHDYEFEPAYKWHESSGI